MGDGVFQQTSFNAGLLSEFLGSRSDAPKVYERGCSILERFLPTVEGPIVRCPGTRFLAAQADETASARLIPFRFSTEQAYQLEFGDGVLRVFRDQELVLDGAHTAVAVEAVTPANPLELLLNTTTGLATGDSIFITGTGVPEINGQFFRITVVSGFNITLDGLDGTTFTSQGAPLGTAQRVYSIASPFTSAQAQALQFAQAGDVVYLACRGVARQKVSRLADDDWSFEAIDEAEVDTNDRSLGFYPPFAKFNTTSAELAVAADTAPGGSVNITSDTAGTFTVNDVGRYLLLQGASAEMGYGLVTAFVSGTEVTVTVYSRFPNGSARFTSSVLVANRRTRDWAWGAYDAVNGYPASVALLDGRLWWAGTSSDPALITASIADNFENHRRYDADPTGDAKLVVSLTSGFIVSPRSGVLDDVLWMIGLDVLYFGTLGGEWIIRSSNPEQAVGPNNLLVRQQGRVGSRSNVSPIAVDSVVLFTQRAGRKLKEFVFNDTTQSYESPDMTRLSRDVTIGRVRSIAFQQEPNRVVWVVLEDGSLLAFTYERQEDVAAWSIQTIAGTDAFVESVSVTPSVTEDEDEVWLTVRRTINGVTRRYVEVIQPFWTKGDDPGSAFFVDSGLSAASLSAGTVHGLLHLIGETLEAQGDGASLGDLVVSEQGSIELPQDVDSLVVGLGYRPKYRSMRAEFGGSAFRAAPAAGHRKRAVRAAIRLIDAGPGLHIGTTFDEMDEIPFREPEDAMDTAVPLFTGDTGFTPVPGGFDLDGYVCLEQRGPLPCTVAALTARMTSEEVA